MTRHPRKRAREKGHAFGMPARFASNSADLAAVAARRLPESLRLLLPQSFQRRMR